VRHATADDLVSAEPLLSELRGLPELKERKPGSFSRGSRAFLHFHEDAGDLYVDVKLQASFERVKVTTPEEQSELILRVRRTLES
jgi:hypothetical protein